MTDDEEMIRAVAHLDRQVERAGVRTQRLFNRSFERLSELEAILLGLVDRLVATGVVAEQDLVAAARQVEAGAVDCAARMPVCRAICCQLSVSLSAAEVESGRLRWDLGHPYRLRREADGRCTHQVRATGWCGVYEERPLPCRTYTCATDGRIWKDFAAMELNTEWLAAHFVPDEPRFTPPKARPPRPLRLGPSPAADAADKDRQPADSA